MEFQRTTGLMRLMTAAVMVLAIALGGCSWLGIEMSKDPSDKWDADRLYAEARAEMSSANWVKAREYYQKLESRYPFSRHAQQALMEIAYTYYKEGESAQAITTADRFIRQYPNNPNVDYMYYLKGLAAFNEDLGLLGRFTTQDLSERDAKAAREAFDAFRDLVNRFPESKYAEDSRARMRYLINAQARTELGIAKFYFARRAYVAAIQRAQVVVRDFQNSTVVEDALVLMARSYEALQLKDLQADAERVIALNFPQSEYLQKR
jgi:outer membrane protein assembly factor BamD